MQDSKLLHGLVRDTVTPGWAARLYAGIGAATGLALPVLFYGVLRNIPLLKQHASAQAQGLIPSLPVILQIAGGVSTAILIACLAWPRAARECNRAGLWPTILGLADTIRLRRLILDTPYALVLVRYRKNFVSLLDTHNVFLRLATACANRQGVFLDHALSTTKQELFFAGDLAQRLVDYSNDIPESERDLRQDLLAVAQRTEWMNIDIATSILQQEFRTPV